MDPAKRNLIIRRRVKKTGSRATRAWLDGAPESIEPELLASIVPSLQHEYHAVENESTRLFKRAGLWGRYKYYFVSKITDHRSSGTSVIRRAPGGRLLGFADFLCSPKTMQLTVKPLAADWRKEYFDALSQNRTKKARWISIRYYYYFVKAFGLDKVLKLVKAVRTSGK